MAWAQEIGERIRQARDALGLSRSALGDLIETHEKSIGNYERGEHVPWDKLPKISDVLNCDLRWLLHGQRFQDPLLDVQAKVWDVQAKLEHLLALGVEQELEDAAETDRRQASDSEAGDDESGRSERA